jgi:hypothetical protein
MTVFVALLESACKFQHSASAAAAAAAACRRFRMVISAHAVMPAQQFSKLL